MEYLQKLRILFLQFNKNLKSKIKKETKENKMKIETEVLKKTYKTNIFNKERGKYIMAVKQGYALVLGFKNSKEKTCTITIDNVKESLTQENITPVMDALLADNIITTSTGDDLVSKVFAKVVAKTETDYQYQ